jgi:hypothetical protein
MKGINTLQLFIANNKAIKGKLLQNIKEQTKYKQGVNVHDSIFNEPIVELTEREKQLLNHLTKNL